MNIIIQCYPSIPRFSFLHETSGLVSEVRYPPEEDPHVVNIKKGILGCLVGDQQLPVGGSTGVNVLYRPKNTHIFISIKGDRPKAPACNTCVLVCS